MELKELKWMIFERIQQLLKPEIMYLRVNAWQTKAKQLQENWNTEL